MLWLLINGCLTFERNPTHRLLQMNNKQPTLMAFRAPLHAVPKLHEHVKSSDDDRSNGTNVVRESSSLIDLPVVKVSTLIHKFITWSQVPANRHQSDQYAIVSNRNPAALRRPAPSHYMISNPLIRMHEPDPSSLEIEQFSQLIGAKEWKEMRRDLDK